MRKGQAANSLRGIVPSGSTASLSQAANPVWRSPALAVAPRVSARARRRARVRRMVDAVVWAVILAATGMCFSVYYRARAELATALSKHQVVLGRVSEVQREIHQLELEIRQLRSDPRMIESIARSQLGLIRPGEVVIRLGSEEEGDRNKSASEIAASVGPLRNVNPAMSNVGTAARKLEPARNDIGTARNNIDPPRNNMGTARNNVARARRNVGPTVGKVVPEGKSRARNEKSLAKVGRFRAGGIAVQSLRPRTIRSQLTREQALTPESVTPQTVDTPDR